MLMRVASALPVGAGPVISHANKRMWTLGGGARFVMLIKGRGHTVAWRGDLRYANEEVGVDTERVGRGLIVTTPTLL